MSARGFMVSGSITPDAIERGLPASYINEVAGGLDRATVVRLVGAGSTLRRKISGGDTLSLVESDRLARIQRLKQRAIEVFGSQDKAAHWLTRPSRHLRDGRTPLEMLGTDPGTRWVEARLDQIEYGVFA